ncbi:MAG: preprotein translocase subunit SecG [Candidatus Marinimicrobia bacterium]|nr:preprotein translocase subunit SecG [Candidatus Neomarinimicrobiota bacterium]
MLYTFLVIVFVTVCLMLIGIILIQSSKTGGMGTAMGGAAVTAAFGGQGADKLLTRITTGFAVTFMVLALLLSWLDTPGSENSAGSESIISQKADSDMQGTAPALDIIPEPEATPASEEEN